tara:strand:+ start:208 stop:426 length:219 start_codon:yes stop_codon:yes gene_type:complete
MKAHQWCSINTKECSSWKIIECGDATIELLEDLSNSICPWSLSQRSWINRLNACNINILDNPKDIRPEYNLN